MPAVHLSNSELTAEPSFTRVVYFASSGLCFDCDSAFLPLFLNFVHSSIVCIGFATAASYGIVSWFDLTLSPVNSTLVPFLSMGLGIDDLFVLMHEYLRSHNEQVPLSVYDQDLVSRFCFQDYVHNRMVITLMNAGSSITVTSAANFAAFLIPAILVREFPFVCLPIMDLMSRVFPSCRPARCVHLLVPDGGCCGFELVRPYDHLCPCHGDGCPSHPKAQVIHALRCHSQQRFVRTEFLL